MDILEKDIEARFVREVEKRNGLCLKFVSPGTAGVPDRVVLVYGVVRFVELKAPGKKPRPLQQKVFREFKEHGQPVEVISSVGQIDAFFRKLEEGWWK